MTTNISKLSGNKFQLIFPLLPQETSISAQQQFSLNIIDGVLPSFSLNSEDIPYRGGNLKYEMGFGEFGPWTTTFFIDSSFESWIVLADWMFSIADNKETFGRSDQSYSVDANLHILDNFDNKVVDIKFENIWPSELGDVKVTYQDGESLLSCDVTFSYDRFYKS